jgi:TetR/AcrR family fatty acid metabolism transcriptional regulator
LNEASFIAHPYHFEDQYALTADKKKNSDKHRRIIEAAIKVFAKNGFYNSKVSEIARAAQVADGTIYLYFQNKDDILISLFEEVMQGVLDRVETAIAQETDPSRKLERFAQAHLSLVEENQEVSEIIQVEIRQSSKFMRGYDNVKFVKYLNIISEIIREGQAQGLFRPDVKPGIAKRAFFGALDEMSRYWVLSSAKKYSISTAAREISTFFLQGMLTERGRQQL